MIIAKCIFKIRDDKGNIILYRLVDTSGNMNEVKPVELKKAIACSQISVVNLTLTKDNRLVDSNFNEELSSTKLVGHTPNNELSEKLKNYIMVNGLVHFFYDKFLEDTRIHGLKTSYEGIRSMNEKEKNCIWFFINTANLEIAAKEYMSKKSEHRTSDIQHLCKAVWYPNYEEVSKLRYRKTGRAVLLIYSYNAPAFVYKQDIPADRLKISRY